MPFASQPVSATLDKIIGRGISSPVHYSNRINFELLERSEGLDVIFNSLTMLFNTRIGERINNPEYGCELQSLVFEPNDTILQVTAYSMVKEAIDRWERRVSIRSIKFNVPNDSQLDIVIAFVINNTHVEGTYVYPFVLRPMPEIELVRGRDSINGVTF